MAKNKQLNLIANTKMLSIGFINKYTVNSGIGEGAIQCQLITNYFSHISFHSLVKKRVYGPRKDMFFIYLAMLSIV